VCPGGVPSCAPLRERALECVASLYPQLQPGFRENFKKKSKQKKTPDVESFVFLAFCETQLKPISFKLIFSLKRN
jgi:hypothetical protein